MNSTLQNSIISPFGGKSTLLTQFHTHELARRYKEKCGVDISGEFGTTDFAELYQCEITGYKFWYPYTLAGSEHFYTLLSASWPDYYRTDRWEYDKARSFVHTGDRCLEIGCGRGYFLRSIESISSEATGLEFNREAIEQSVCTSPILNETLEEYANQEGESRDCVFAFQVLEHVPDPLAFLKDCVRCLKSGGNLIVSVPNDDFVLHRDMMDAFNLPPHHMGGYNKQILEKIGTLLSLKMVDSFCAPPAWPGLNVTEAVSASPAWRLFSKLSQRLGRPLLRSLREPGHTILAIYKKP